MKKADVQRNLRRGVFVIPTFLTVMNLFFGFRCMVNSMRAMQAITDGRPDEAMKYFQIACVALFIAAIFDTFAVLVPRTDDNNLAEFELLAGNDGPAGSFTSCVP